MADPGLVVLRRNLKSALAHNRFDEAQTILDRLKRELPLDRQTLGLELELLLKQGLLDEARALAQRLRHRFADSSRILFLSGQVAYRCRDYPDAERLFRESIKLHPHWRSRYWLGRTLTQVGALDEAQELLEEAVTHFRFALNDLAWLFERKENFTKATQCYEQLLQLQPDNQYVKDRLTRLKAMMLTPDALVAEMETMTELGEEIPDHLFPEYIKKLFQTGQGRKARLEIAAREAELGAREGTQSGWECYHAGAYDLAFELFTRFFGLNRANYKFLNSLEAAARKCNKIDALIELYQDHAPSDPNFYGRIKKLSR